MSQQEFVSPSQSQQSQEEHAFNDEEAYNPQHPYSWSSNKAGVPRDEPPSSYDEPMVQRGYLLILVIGTVFFALLLAFVVIMIISILSFIFRVPLRRRSPFPPWLGPLGW